MNDSCGPGPASSGAVECVVSLGVCGAVLLPSSVLEGRGLPADDEPCVRGLLSMLAHSSVGVIWYGNSTLTVALCGG